MTPEPPFVLVALFTQPGCGACDAYKPKFARAIARYPGLPVQEFDVNSEDPEVVGFMDRTGVMATPTVVIAQRGGGAKTLAPPINDVELHQWLQVGYRIHHGQ